MILSIVAIAIVMLAMPASLSIVDAWNNAISNDYETFIEFNNETSSVQGSTFDMPAPHKAVYIHYNNTNIRENSDQNIYDKEVFSDAYYRIVLSASDTTDSSANQDKLILSLNTTAYSLASNAANRMKIHVDAGKPVSISLAYQNDAIYGDTIIQYFELNSTTNYTYTTDIDLAKLLSLENAYPDGHFTLIVKSYNETEELTPGDVIVLSWQFLKKKGAVATIYTVDNLMLGWGVALIVLAFASTPFFNPMSRDVFPFITKMRRSRAAKKAASKRKRSRKKPRSSKRSSKRKRSRR